MPPWLRYSSGVDFENMNPNPSGLEDMPWGHSAISKFILKSFLKSIVFGAYIAVLFFSLFPIPGPGTNLIAWFSFVLGSDAFNVPVWCGPYIL